MVEEVHKNGQNLNCKIKVLENGTIVEFSYIYYPGYKIIVNADFIKGLVQYKELVLLCAVVTT